LKKIREKQPKEITIKPENKAVCGCKRIYNHRNLLNYIKMKKICGVRGCGRYAYAKCGVYSHKDKIGFGCSCAEPKYCGRLVCEEHMRIIDFTTRKYENILTACNDGICAIRFDRAYRRMTYFYSGIILFSILLVLILIVKNNNTTVSIKV